MGPDKKDFGIHKGLLCRRSRFFKAACNGSFSEASKGTVELPEEDVETFAIVYTWLYSGKITLEKDGKDVACACFHFAQLWIFGDKFDMPSLCDEAIDGILHEYQDKNVIMMAYARPIYSSTAKDSMLRKALVATYIGIGAKLASFLETNAASL